MFSDVGNRAAVPEDLGTALEVAPGTVGTMFETHRLRAVIFDLGGVVLGAPLPALFALEAKHGCQGGFLLRHIALGEADGLWARLERGELDIESFDRAFTVETEVAGCAIRGRDVLDAIRGATAVRPRMLRAIDAVRAGGLLTGVITNNWIEPGQEGRHAGLADRFDVFVESAVLGIRKPEPAIYLEACRLLGVAPAEVVFLDDIGSNLKPAREMGMFTIKVDHDPAGALAELSEVLGFPV